jgi:hypothetical protein
LWLPSIFKRLGYSFLPKINIRGAGILASLFFIRELGTGGGITELAPWVSLRGSCCAYQNNLFLLDAQDQETSQPAKPDEICQVPFLIPRKILKWIDLV